MADDDNPFEEFNQLARAMLGASVIAWSQVEVCTDNAVKILLVRSGMSEEAGNLIVLNLGVREKCSIIGALGYHHRLDDKWLSDVLAVINLIANDLRNQRNRMLHDVWSTGIGDVIQRQKRTSPRVTRPQARQFEIALPGSEVFSPDDVGNFEQACIAAISKLNELMLAHLRHTEKMLLRESGERLQEPQTPSDPRLRRWPQKLQRLLRSWRE